MAIVIRGLSVCAICSSIIGDYDEIVATSPFVADQGDPFWQFSDAVLHRRCFETWDLREELIERFNDAMRDVRFDNGSSRHMRADGIVEVVEENA